MRVKLYLVKLMMLVLLPTMLFSACSSSSDDESGESSELQTLIIGTWRFTQMESKGEMVDITTSIMEELIEPTYATFYTDGTYKGKGFFGNGSGTYKVSGNTIYTYISGSEYLKYIVTSYTKDKAELTIAKTGSSSTIKAVVERQ